MLSDLLREAAQLRVRAGVAEARKRARFARSAAAGQAMSDHAAKIFGKHDVSEFLMRQAASKRRSVYFCCCWHGTRPLKGCMPTHASQCGGAARGRRAGQMRQEPLTARRYDMRDMQRCQRDVAPRRRRWRGPRGAAAREHGASARQIVRYC